MSSATFYKLNKSKKSQARPAPTPGISQTSITLITFALVAIAIYFIIKSQPGLASEGQGLISQIGAGLKKSGIDFSGTFGFLKKIITDPKGFAEEEIFSDQAQKELEQIKNPGVEIQTVSPVTDPTFLFPVINPTAPDEDETKLALQGFIKAVSIERKFPICVKLWASIDANQNLYMDCTPQEEPSPDDPSTCPQIQEIDDQNKILLLKGTRFPNSPFVCTTPSQEILTALPALPTDANFPLQAQVNLAYSYKAHAQKQVFIADKNTYFQILGRGEDPAIRFNIDSTKISSYTSKGPVNLGIGIGAGGDLTDLILSNTLNFLTLQINNQGDGAIKPKDIFIILPGDIQIPQSSLYEYDPTPTSTDIKQNYCKKMRPNDAKCDQRLTNMGILRLSQESLKKSKFVDQDGFIKDTKTLPLSVTVPNSFLSGLEVSSMTIIVEMSYEYHQEKKLSINVRKVPTPEEEATTLAQIQTGETTPAGPPPLPATTELSILKDSQIKTLQPSQINEILETERKIRDSNGNLQPSPSPALSEGPNIGEKIFSMGEEFNIDPIFALAFFWKESQFGTASNWAGRPNHLCGPQGSKNPGNLRYTSVCAAPRGLCLYTAPCGEHEGAFGKYDTWEQGFRGWFNLITNSNKYIKGGRTTVEKIIPTYAPASENNVNAYISVVRSKVHEWRTKYNLYQQPEEQQPEQSQQQTTNIQDLVSKQIPAQILSNIPALPSQIQQLISQGKITTLSEEVRSSCYDQALLFSFLDITNIDASTASGQISASETLRLRGSGCATGINQGIPFRGGDTNAGIYYNIGRCLIGSDVNTILKQTTSDQTSNVANILRGSLSDEKVNSDCNMHKDQFIELLRIRGQ